MMKPISKKKKIACSQTCEMVLQVKTPVANPDNLSSVLGTHRVEGAN